MVRSRHLPLYSASFSYIKEIYRVRIRLPKVLKHDLGHEVFHSAIRILKRIVIANGTKDKIFAISEILMEIELQWVFLRLLYDLKAISEGQFKAISVRLEGMERQAEAWLKWQKKKLAEKKNKE